MKIRLILAFILIFDTISPCLNAKNPQKKGPPDNPWALASEGTQLAVTILLGFFIGFYTDQKKGTFPWLTLTGAFLGIAFGLYNFLKRFLK